MSLFDEPSPFDNMSNPQKASWLHDYFEEAKQHLHPRDQWNYALEPEKLTKDDKTNIEVHLNGCDLCQARIRNLESNKDIYLSMPDDLDDLFSTPDEPRRPRP